MPLQNVTISPMQQADVPTCAAWINRRPFYESYRLIDPSITDQDRLDAKIGLLHHCLSDPNMFLRVARHEGRVVGWIAWTKPQDVQTPHPHPAPVFKAHVETDDALKDGMRADKEIKRKHFIGDQPSWTLQMLFVDPNIWRSGVGRMLLETCLREIGPGAPIALSSSPWASHLYRQYGFRIVSWYDYLTEDLDKDGKMVKYRYRWPFMTNFWEGREEEVDAAEKRAAHEDIASEDPELAYYDR